MADIPKIRFKGFTEPWEQRKLGDIAEFNKGSGYSKGDLVESGTPIILYGRLYTKYETSISEVDTYVKAKDGSVYSKGGEVIVPASGETAEDIARAATVDKSGVILGGDLNVVSPNEDINSAFLAISISHGNSQRQLAKKAQGKSVVHIHNEEIKNLVVPFPANAEQNKIVEYFSNLDHLITLHQRKCDDTKELKKYMLQKMFPKNGEKFPEIRFKGFTEAWEQRKLEDFGKATGGTSIESEFSEDGVYKVISIGSYSENSVYNDQGIRAIKSDKTSNRVLNRNDLTMILNDKTTSGNIIGRVLLIEESGIYVYNQRTERIEINLDEYDPVFLYEMLNAPNIREKIIKQAQGNTQIYVNWTTISLLEYMIPSKEEQVKIGEHLYGISNLIALHQRKCDTLKELKKYMLQNMFPKKG